MPTSGTRRDDARTATKYLVSAFLMILKGRYSHRNAQSVGFPTERLGDARATLKSPS